MAGNDQAPGTGGFNSSGSREPQRGPSGEKPALKTFACTNCGASITVRYLGHSLSVVCESCRSVLDARDENLRVVDQHFKITQQFKPKLPLGTRGTLKGRQWEVIGFMVRQDAVSYFAWEEYLLFNPYYGYRWLTLNNGHWSLVTMLKRKPESWGKYYAAGTESTAKFDGKQYKLFYLGKASVLYVLGEFYWTVKVGSEANMADYICPPYMLSREGDKNENVWSQSEYITAGEMKKAFKELEELPLAIGIAPNQPTESKKVMPMVTMLWVTFLVLLFCLQTIHMTGARNERVLAKTYSYTTNTQNPTVTTPTFKLEKKKANVQIEVRADVDNSWFYVYGELVNDDNDLTYTFERTIEYYHGYEGGESWTEGSRHNSFIISAVPEGKYYLNLYTQSGDYKVLDTKSYDIQVDRDVSTYANFFWSLLFLSFIPIIIWFRTYTDEVMRWSDSDFSPYQSDE